MWTAVYWNMYRRQTRSWPTLAKALEFLKSGDDDGWLDPVEVIAPTGTTAVRESEIMNAIHSRGVWAGKRREKTIKARQDRYSITERAWV